MLIGYARVSSAEQNLDLQRDALGAAGRKKIFTDKMSGARADRPGLAEALNFDREGDGLIVWRLDRLGRSLSHVIEIVRDLQQRGVGFRSLTETIDTMTSGGKLTFHVFGALAEFEKDPVRDGTLAGLHAARQRGRIGGRHRSMIKEKIKAAAKLLADGNPPKDVASIIGVSVPRLYRWLPAPKTAASNTTRTRP
jgi:DNA invertase Pin-like site-specific DNA recombinase